MPEGADTSPKQTFPDDYYRYDVGNYRKFLDTYMDDIRNAYGAQIRNNISSVVKTKDMRIIICGMGGSAIAGDLLKSYLYNENIGIELVQDYKIFPEPRKTDLVIISSYSGNTEEAISCHRQARGIGAQVIIITSGGKLEEGTASGRMPLVKLPKGYSPRAALNHIFFSLLRIFEELGLTSPKREDVKALLDYLQRTSLKEFAINLSEKIYGKVPIIYASKLFYPIAYRWRTQINENAKALAFSGALPEIDHNELEGFQHKNGIYHVIMISTDEDYSRMHKRMRITKEMIQKQGVDVTELNIKGNRLVKLFSAVLMGDMVSYYLALRYRVDPLPVSHIEDLKKDMGPFI